MSLSTAAALHRAVATSHPGDLIQLAPVPLQLTRPLQITHDLRITGGARLEMTAPGLLLDHISGHLELWGLTLTRAVGSEEPLIRTSAGHLELRDCRLRGGDPSQHRVGLYAAARARLTAHSSTVEGFDVGLHATHNTSVSLLGCTLTRNRHGATLDDSCQAELRACDVKDNGADGIVVAGTSHADLEGNTSAGNAQSGVRYSGHATGLVHDNTCRRNLLGIVVNVRAAPTLRSNTCEHNRLVGIRYGGRALGEAIENACRGNKVGLEILEQAAPILRGNLIRDNQADQVGSGRTPRHNLPAVRASHLAPLHTPRQLQVVPPQRAPLSATIAVLVSTSVALLIPSLPLTLIGLFGTWGAYAAWGAARRARLQRLLRDGQVTRGRVISSETVARLVTVTWRDPWGVERTQPFQAFDADIAASHNEGIEVDVVFDPRAPWRAVGPALLAASFWPTAPPADTRPLLPPSPIDDAALAEAEYEAFVTSPEPARSRWPRVAPPRPVGVVGVDARALTWRGEDGRRCAIPWDALTAHLSAWLLDEATAEVALTARASMKGAASASEEVVVVKARLPQGAVSSRLPLQQVRAPYVGGEAMLALWGAVRAGARLGGGEATGELGGGG